MENLEKDFLFFDSLSFVQLIIATCLVYKSTPSSLLVHPKSAPLVLVFRLTVLVVFGVWIRTFGKKKKTSVERPARGLNFWDDS